MMKKLSIAIFTIACTLLCTPNTYAKPNLDDPAWNQLLEGKSTKIPNKIPTAKAVVSRANAAHRQQIVNPIDMRNHTNIELSDFAVKAHKYFASQTQKNFIEATTKELRKLSGNPNIKLPIAELGFDTYEFPIANARTASIEVEFGWFAKQNNENITIPRGNYNINKHYIRPNTDLRTIDILPEKYIEICNKQIKELRKLDHKRLNVKLNEIRKQALEEAKNDSKILREENKLHKNQQDNQALLDEKWARIQARENAGDAGWDPGFNGGDALADEREERRKQIKQRNKNKQNKNKQNYELDLVNTWNMIEAIVTQTEVPIAKLTIPLAIEEVLLLHAKTNHRPENIIKRVLELNIKTKATGGNISVTLACSTTDRLMGCKNIPNYADPVGEQKLQNIITNLEKVMPKADKKQTEFINTLIANIKGIFYLAEEDELNDEEQTQTKNKKKSPKGKLGDPGADLPF